MTLTWGGIKRGSISLRKISVSRMEFFPLSGGIIRGDQILIEFPLNILYSPPRAGDLFNSQGLNLVSQPT
jgi:hypothetical protein